MQSKNDKKNKKNKNIYLSDRINGNNWIDSLNHIGSFAVFGGDDNRRINTVLRCIARCYGQKAIIILHNNDLLVSNLCKFYSFYPDLYEFYGNKIKKCFVDTNNLVYEPFFGMDKSRVIEIIYASINRDNAANFQLNNCAEALNKYLSLLEKKEQVIDLDGLISLCNMSFNKLVNTCMKGLSDYEKEDFISSLTYNNSYVQVKNDINAFARTLEGRIWHHKQIGESATDISIIEAIKNKAILSIKTDISSGVLDYLFKEIHLAESNRKDFLLVLDSVSLINSNIAIDTILYPNRCFDMVVSGNNISEIMGDEHKVDLLLDKLNDIIIMRCSNSVIANVYSNYIGQYKRIVEQKTYDPQKLFFDEFGSLVQYHKEDDYRIPANELVDLGNGAILIKNGANREIYKTEKFII